MKQSKDASEQGEVGVLAVRRPTRGGELLSASQFGRLKALPHCNVPIGSVSLA